MKIFTATSCKFASMKRLFISIPAAIIAIAIISSFLEKESIAITTKAALGKKLFSEKILSKDSTISCASCHKPTFAFADTSALGKGDKKIYVIPSKDLVVIRHGDDTGDAVLGPSSFDNNFWAKLMLAIK